MTAAGICACGGSPTKEAAPAAAPEPAGNYFVGADPVYAHLRAGSGGSWVFTTITNVDRQPDSGYLVRLNDLTPAFDTRIAECAPQNYPDEHRCSVTNPFREKDAGLVDKLISGGIAVGTAGKVTDISANYETSFDEAAFNQAVDEALVNTGLDATRRQLIANIDQYNRLADQGRAELGELRRQATESRRNMVSAFRYQVRPTVDGLIDFYGGDIDYNKLVTLTAKKAENFTRDELGGGPVLPCEVRTCLADSTSALARLQRELDEQRSGLAREISPESVPFVVQCDPAAVESYLVRADCPEEVTLHRGVLTQIPISVTILSRDFDGLFPEFSITDEQLAVKIDGQRVRFTNPTQNYLTVTAQTLYYNALVETSALSIELAPGVSVSHPIGEFVSPAIEVESSYQRMTPGKAENTSFRFGFAARYHVANSGEVQTLYATDTFNVGCTIENRLKPGSCRHESAAAKEKQQASAAPE
jgi:hypothetical protein